MHKRYRLESKHDYNYNTKTLNYMIRGLESTKNLGELDTFGTLTHRTVQRNHESTPTYLQLHIALAEMFRLDTELESER